MKIPRLIIFSMVVILSFPAYVLAHGGEDHDEAQEATGGELAERGTTSKAVEVGNTICPVSGERVDSQGGPVKYEYNGKIYNFCCKMCIKDFKKDPEKYIKKMEESAGKE